MNKPAYAAIVMAVLLTSCTSRAEREQSKLMDEIESRIRLPDGADPLSRYARIYTLERPGLVAGTYFPPRAPRPADWGCSEIDENLQLKKIDCDKLPIDPLDSLKAGDRLWIEKDMFPGMADGGCSIINVAYNVSTRTVEKAECNGP